MVTGHHIRILYTYHQRINVNCPASPTRRRLQTRVDYSTFCYVKLGNMVRYIRRPRPHGSDLILLFKIILTPFFIFYLQ